MFRNLKWWQATILIVTILFATGYVLSEGVNLWRAGENWTEPYSYMIGADGTDYWAKNGKTAQIDFRGTNASQVINAAISNLPKYAYTSAGWGGGTIYLKGVFQISNTIIVDRPLNLIGVPDNTDSYAYLLANGLNGRMLQMNLPGQSFHFKLENLHFEGANTTRGNTGGDYMVYISNGYGILDNIFVMRAYGTGIYMGASDVQCSYVYSEYNGFGSGAGDGWYCDALNCQYYSCTAWNNSRNGFYFTQNQVRGLMDGCRAAWNQVGIKTQSGDSQIMIQGCSIFDNYQEGTYLVSSDHIQMINNVLLDNGILTNGAYSGIRLSTCVNCTVSANNIYDDGTQSNLMKYAVSEDGASDYNLIQGNNLQGAPVSTTGTHTQVHLCYNGTTWIS